MGNDVALAILAGGEGSRMGFPKQHLQIDGKPVLEYLVDRFGWTGPTLLVTTPGRERPTGALRFDAEAVDAVPNQGPLRGVLTALKNAKTRIVVITTVDMPCVTRQQLRWLASRLRDRPDLLGLMLQRSENGNIQIEPFPFACKTEAIEAIAACLEQGRRSLHALASTPDFTAESAPEQWPVETWTNLNYPEDFEAFIRRD